MDVHAAGIDAALRRLAAGAAAVRPWRQLGGGRCALPPRPRPPLPPPPPPRVAECRRGGGEDAARDAGAAGDGTRDARRGAGPGKAEEVVGGGGVSRSGVLAPADPDADTAGGNAVAGGVADASDDDGAARVAVVVAPREGRGGGEVGSKRPFATSAHPPPKRRLVSATRRFPPGCGRVAADGGGSRLVAAPGRPGDGSAALPKEPAPPPHSVGEAGSSAAAVPHGQDDGALGSPEPSRHRSVAAADGLLDTESKGSSGSSGFVSGKLLVAAKRLLPKPTMVYAIRRFPPGFGRVTASQPLNKSADECPCTESKELSSPARGSSGLKKKVIVKCPSHLGMKVSSAYTPGCGRVTASQPLDKPADECPLTESKELSAAGGSSGFKKKNKVIVKCPAQLGMKVASASTTGSINKLDDIEASILQDDGFLKALADYERKLELKFNVSSDVPSVGCQGQHGIQNADARSKVKMICKRFQFICRATVSIVKMKSPSSFPVTCIHSFEVH